MTYEDDDDDYEPTAMIGMMSEFQKELGIDKSKLDTMDRKPEHSFMQQSLVASFMEQEENLSLLGKENLY